MDQTKTRAALAALMIVALAAAGSAAASHHQMMHDTADLRVLHAVPGGPPVDVWVDNVRAVENLSFGENTSYLRIPEGRYLVRVVPTGATEPVLIEGWAGVAAGRAYTLAAVGTPDEIGALAVRDGARGSPMMAVVRVVHLSPDAPSVDVAPAGGDPLVSELGFRESSERIRLPGGTYDLEVRPAGGEAVALSIPNVTLTEGTHYTAYAVGSVEEGTLELMLLEDAMRKEKMRRG